MKATKIYLVTTAEHNDEGCSHYHRVFTEVFQTYPLAKESFLAHDNQNLALEKPDLATYGTPLSLYEVTLVPTNEHTYFEQLNSLIRSASYGHQPSTTNTVLLDRNWKYSWHTADWKTEAVTSPRHNAPHDPKPTID